MTSSSEPANSSRFSAGRRFLIRAWPWGAAIASGGLLTLCLEPWNQSWLCWFALTPLLAAIWSMDANAVQPATRNPQPATRLPQLLREPSVRGFALGYAAGLIFFWTAFYWLWEVTGPGWFLLAPYMGLYFAVWGAFMATVAKPRIRSSPTQTPWERSERRLFAASAVPIPPSPFLRSRWNLWSAFLGAAAWVALEWVRGWALSGFGWNDLGVGLHRVIPLIQIAEWTGVGGVSFLAVFVNIIAVATIFRFAAEIRIHKVRPHFDLTLTLAAVLLTFGFGIRCIQTAFRDSAQPDAAGRLRVTAVQPNIPQSDKWSPALQIATFQTLHDVSETALSTRPDLLLWPEAATPLGLFGDRANYEFVMEIFRRAHCNFLIGTIDYDFGDDGRSQADYNAAVLLPKGGGDAQVYRKIHLVPFGEYVPYRHQFPPLAWAVGSQVPSDLTAGSKPVVFDTAHPPVHLAPLICFEDTIGDLTRQPVLRGAQLLINLTNDGWFGETAASAQHLAEATFRTVENRRPLVSCANNGVTAFLDSEGRVTQTLRMPNGTVWGAGILSGQVAVPLHPNLTFYTRHGEIFSIACADAAGLAALLSIWRRLRQSELRRRERRRVAATQPATAEAGIAP